MSVAGDDAPNVSGCDIAGPCTSHISLNSDPLTLSTKAAPRVTSHPSHRASLARCAEAVLLDEEPEDHEVHRVPRPDSKLNRTLVDTSRDNGFF